MTERNGILQVITKDGSNVRCGYYVKALDESSEDYGIDGGKIIKLSIQIGECIVCRYDRGWSTLPNCEAAKLAYNKIIATYN